MNKSCLLTAGIIGGIGLGTMIAILLADRNGSYCPLCGSRLQVENGSVFCGSCNVRMPVEDL